MASEHREPGGFRGVLRSFGMRDQRTRIRDALAARSEGRPGRLAADDEAALAELVAAGPPIADDRLADARRGARDAGHERCSRTSHGVAATRVDRRGADKDVAAESIVDARGPRSYPVRRLRRGRRPRGEAPLPHRVLDGARGRSCVASLAGVAVWRELTMDLPSVTELLDYRAADGDPRLRGRRHADRRVLRRAALPDSDRRGARARPAGLPRRRGRGLLPASAASTRRASCAR